VPSAQQDPCGSVHVHVHAVALADQHLGTHEETLDQTWPIPKGVKSQYGNSSDGAIVTQGWPSNGGAHSWEYLTTECTVTPQGDSPEVVRLNLHARSNLDSGVGGGTGASSDYDSEWFVVRTLPSSPNIKSWNLTIVGTISASGTTPSCSFKVNSGTPTAIPPGPFIKTVTGLSGLVAIFVSCAQGHQAIFPNGPNRTGADVRVDDDVTLSFSRS
jgi:hypothetical protein